jgi:hypothetical protein
MNEKTDFVLVKRPSSALEKVAPGAKRVLSGMVADALALAKKDPSALAAAKFRIGDYEWCEPDYRQIHIWAKATGIFPEQILQILKKATPDTCWAKPGPAFYQGRLLRLSWDFGKLPLKTFEWVEGLRITHFSLKTLLVSDEQRVLNDLDLALPHLTHLGCCGAQGFNRSQGLNPAADAWSRLLNLLRTPELEELSCIGCGLSALELSSFKKLHRLRCTFNRLSQLDLSAVPDLKSLNCGDNYLSQLDLSAVPGLTVLDCADNSFSELDLTPVPDLTFLGCGKNHLAELDISKISRLKGLNCDGNKLTHLTFPIMPELAYLSCSKNSLSNLDLSNAPNLTSLYCSENKIARLDLNLTPRLETLSCESNQIRVLDIQPLKFLKTFYYDRAKVHLIQRPDQNL